MGGAARRSRTYPEAWIGIGVSRIYAETKHRACATDHWRCYGKTVKFWGIIPLENKENEMTVTPSTTLITTSYEVATTAFDNVSLQNAAQHAIDIRGMANQAYLQLTEARKTLTLIGNVADPADPQLASINNMLASLV
jgi:hypothetical protein